jgi:hypothetical protein
VAAGDAVVGGIGSTGIRKPYQHITMPPKLPALSSLGDLGGEFIADD